MTAIIYRIEKILFKILLGTSCSLLILAYCAGLFAPYYYFFDLLGHFVLQYMILAAALFIIAALFKQKKWAAIMWAMVLICFYHSRIALHNPLQFNARSPHSTSELTIASWNQNLYNLDKSKLPRRISEYDADVILLQEANSMTLQLALEMQERYPHQINGIGPAYKRPMSYMVLSRHPIINQKIIRIHDTGWKNHVLRFQVQPKRHEQPFTIYAVHTHSPSRKEHQKRRDKELELLAGIIADDNAKHIIVAGDINTSPYIPAFRNFVKNSLLYYQSYGVFLTPTWPTIMKTDALRVPIDHMFYNSALKQDFKKTALLNNSDHLALIAGFSRRVQ